MTPNGMMAAYAGKTKSLKFAFPIEIYAHVRAEWDLPSAPGFNVIRTSKYTWEIRLAAGDFPVGSQLNDRWVLTTGANEFFKTDNPFGSTPAEYRNGIDVEGKQVIFVTRSPEVKERKPKRMKLDHWKKKAAPSAAVAKNHNDLQSVLRMVKGVEDTSPYRLEHDDAGQPVWRAPIVTM